MSNPDPFGRTLDFFPGYEPYGLREIAVSDDPVHLILWLSTACARSFDSLSVANREAFAAAALDYLGNGEPRGAWSKAAELFTAHPHDHAGNVGRAEVSTVGALNRLLETVLELQPDAETLAELADTLSHGARLVSLLHERGRPDP